MMLYLQGQCGSSYAFSAAGAVEGAWAVRHEQLVNISAQNIIDCSGARHHRVQSQKMQRYTLEQCTTRITTKSENV